MLYHDKTNQEIAKTIGQRLEQIRLHQNRTQRELAHELGITPVSYRNLIAGKGKVENLISLLRVLGCLNLLEKLMESDAQTLKVATNQKQGVRQRASGD